MKQKAAENGERSLEKENNNSDLEEGEESICLDPLINLINNNQIVSYNFDAFDQGSLLYKHREWIYHGSLNHNGEKKDVYIKKYSVNNEQELEIALNELKIIITLSDRKHKVSRRIFELYGIHLDKEDNYLFTFFEYIDYETSCLSLNLMNFNQYKEKLIVMKNILKFVFYLHSLGIIHRDIRLEYFFIDDKFKVKTFDFTNAMRLDVDKIDKSKVKDINEIKDIKELENVPKQLIYEHKVPYLTAKYPAPEITVLMPREGWAQDIWSLACALIELLIDYSKYEYGAVEILLSKIFRGENNIVPKIPKDIEENIATILAKCFFLEPFSRTDTLQLLEKFKKYLVKNHLIPFKIHSEDRSRFNLVKDVYKQNYIVEYFQQKKQKEKSKEVEMCRYNHKKPNSFYCETCDEFFCYNCILMSHNHHLFFDTEYDIKSKKVILEYLQSEIEDKFCEPNFVLIEEFRKTFEKDYSDEESRIRRQYESIRDRIDHLERLELQNLENSRNRFLESKFQRVFSESDRISQIYDTFYTNKNQFFAHYNRFNNTLNNNEVSIDYVRKFNNKFNKFNECSEILKSNAEKLIAKCASLRIPGKYIFRHEHYTDDLLKYIKSLESKIYIEKHKFFDYSGNDSLYLTQELLMIIPLTNCVFSYIKNSYKKIQVNFDINKIKVKSFLPGCATLHMGNNFYVTGGELKDEPTPDFLWMNIDEKVIEDATEMNFGRRYHTMVAVGKKYICVVGGWNSNEVEVIDADSLDYWRVLPSMKHIRSDPTVYVFNSTYLYVFGGWDYSKKTCVGEVERYEILDGDGNIRFSRQWELIKIKNNPVYLRKYNMGIIELGEEKNESSEKILLVGGFDDEYDYSSSVIKIEVFTKEPSIFVNKDIKGLPTDGESSFWYEKNFHLMQNDFENEPIAVNFNCFNNIYVYSLLKNEFKLYTNSTQT